MRLNIVTTEVAGIFPAILGMRNPMDSWEKSDTYIDDGQVIIGEQDLILAKKLVKGGAEHCKFLRQIQVWAEFHMPRYWWSEMDTYKFNSKNSCSTMHTIMKKDLTVNDFYIGDDAHPNIVTYLAFCIERINMVRQKYIDTKDYKYVIMMKRMLPESFVQMRTVNTSYAELMNIYHQRKNHRLKEEWVNTFCTWCESLPYFTELCVDK